jgi:hypothetical protein
VKQRAHAEATDRLDLRRPVAKSPVLAEDGQIETTTHLEPLDIRHLLVALTVNLVMSPQSSTSLGVTPKSSVTSLSGSPARHRSRTSSTRTPPRMKMGWPNDRSGSTTMTG